MELNHGLFQYFAFNNQWYKIRLFEDVNNLKLPFFDFGQYNCWNNFDKDGGVEVEIQ
jgi:hypothetical protein